jgi:hypothetical protein
MLRAGTTRAGRGYEQPPPAERGKIQSQDDSNQAARSTRSDKHQAVFAAADRLLGVLGSDHAGSATPRRAIECLRRKTDMNIMSLPHSPASDRNETRPWKSMTHSQVARFQSAFAQSNCAIRHAREHFLAKSGIRHSPVRRKWGGIMHGAAKFR